MSVAPSLQRRIRRGARHLLGWEGPRSHARPGLAACLQAGLSDLVIRSLMDMAVRYWPIAGYLRSRLDPADAILDVGSGPVGISPYLRNPVIGADLRFPGPRGRLRPCRADITRLPFADAAFPGVICVDTLEHLPVEIRAAAVAEIVRCARRFAVVACPCGAESEAYDRRLDAYLRARTGDGDRFLDEHLELGLPRVEEIRGWIERSTRERGRRVRVQVESNVSLDAWFWIQKSKAGVVRRALVLAAFPLLFPLLRRRNRAPAYRQIVYVELEP